MSFETSALPISGGVLVAGFIYAGASLFILGPLVAERTIEASDWSQQCQAGLQAEIEATRTPEKIIPQMDCRSTLGSFLPELAKICDQYGNPDFGGPASSLLRQQEKVRRAAEEKRLALTASQSTSRCDCAANVVAQDRNWAIHAGSLRLISPPQVTRLSSELSRALQSSHCTSRSQ